MDKQLFKIEYAKMKNRFDTWKWWCHVYEVKCIWGIITAIVVITSYFII